MGIVTAGFCVVEEQLHESLWIYQKCSLPMKSFTISMILRHCPYYSGQATVNIPRWGWGTAMHVSHISMKLIGVEVDGSVLFLDKELCWLSKRKSPVLRSILYLLVLLPDCRKRLLQGGFAVPGISPSKVGHSGLVL